MPNKGIFSKKALEEFSSPENLDQHLKITKPSYWILIFAILSIFIGAGIWAFTGNISKSLQVDGIIFPSEGVSSDILQHSGTVTDILVEAGEEVDDGDLLAVVPNSDLLKQIDELKASNSQTSIIEAVKQKYVNNSLIKASGSGTVQSIANLNDSLSVGSSVVSNAYESKTNAKEVLAFVQTTYFNTLQKGMQAQVSPSFASREEYGYMTGVITAISSNPITTESLTNVVGDASSAAQLGIDSNYSYNMVTISLDVDESSKNGCAWSNSKGKELTDIDTKTICSIQIILKENHPIDLVL